MISDADRVDQMGQATREKLAQFIARIERLEAEQAELADDKREVYSEVKSFGFDTKIMKKVISLRKLDASTRAEQEALLDMYEEAVENYSYDQVAPIKLPKVDAILLNLDGSRETIKVDALMTNIHHDSKLYVHYKENAYKQV